MLESAPWSVKTALFDLPGAHGYNGPRIARLSGPRHVKTPDRSAQMSSDKCKNYEENLKRCPCTEDDCVHKGICCECMAHHLKSGGLPACGKAAVEGR